MDKNCDICKYRCSVPYGDNGFECLIDCCEKKCTEFHWGSGKPGTCECWEAETSKEIPFYLQPGWKPRK